MSYRNHYMCSGEATSMNKDNYIPEVSIHKMLQYNSAINFLGLVGKSSFTLALLLMTLCIFCAGIHNSACLVNPQDLAPKHSGSVFGIMNAFGAIPGNFMFVFICRPHSKFSTGCLLGYFGDVQ